MVGLTNKNETTNIDESRYNSYQKSDLHRQLGRLCRINQGNDLTKNTHRLARAMNKNITILKEKTLSLVATLA